MKTKEKRKLKKLLRSLDKYRRRDGSLPKCFFFYLLQHKKD